MVPMYSHNFTVSLDLIMASFILVMEEFVALHFIMEEPVGFFIYRNLVFGKM
jgi:hypothetical protein